MLAPSQFSKPPDRALAHFLSFYCDTKKICGKALCDFREIIIKKRLDKQTRSFYDLLLRTFILQCFFWPAGLISNIFIIVPTELNMTMNVIFRKMFLFLRKSALVNKTIFFKKSAAYELREGKIPLTEGIIY